jgi:ring-1,2-phenylacetyl-CoA epoxidase subunit PaaC
VTATEREMLAGYATALGDDALILAQRMAEWVGSAPQIEEDVALANIGLDLLGQARSLLGYAGQVEGRGRDEDDLAYLRDERCFRNLQIVELPNGDFGATMARLLLFATYQHLLYRRLAAGADATLSAIAAKAVKEVDYHVDHARSWVLRLGDGTAESHERMQAGLAVMWPFVAEMFTPDPQVARLVEAGVAVDVAGLRPRWDAEINAVLEEATLEVPEPGWTARGGRRGVHTEHLGYLLAPLQHIHRSHPGASW